MGRLAKAIILLAALWGGWWLGASILVERGVTGWLSDRRAEGWRAQGDVSVTGFPFRFNAALTDLDLADPATGAAVALTTLDLSAPAYWPGDLTVALPGSPMRFTAGGQTAFVIARNGRASLKLHPGPALQLERLRMTSEGWQINTPQGNLLSGTGLDAQIIQGQTPEAYRFAVTAPQLAPGDMLRQALRVPPDWPLAFDAFVADLTVGFDAPLDRFTLEDRQPQPRAMNLEQVSVQWGTVGLNASGALTIDAQGVPDGTIAVMIDDWRGILELGENAGMIPPTLRPQAELLLTALANLGDDPDSLDLQLRFDAGNAFLGSIALGPAPRLVLH